jgi:hypothetical protein
MKALPISPVGPVTATVSMGRFWRNATGHGAKRGWLQSDAHLCTSDEGLAQARRKTARRIGGENAKQSPPGRHPGERLLQHPDRQGALAQLSHHERRQPTIVSEIGAEQNSAGLGVHHAQDILEESGRNVQHCNCLAHKGQRRRDIAESLGLSRNREVTGPTARGRAQLR